MSDNDWKIGDNKVCSLILEFKEKVLKGLEKDGEELGLLRSFITKRPTGMEIGEGLVIDLGGTNIRVCCVSLKKGLPPSINEIMSWPLSDYYKFNIEDLNKEDGIFVFVCRCLKFFWDSLTFEGRNLLYTDGVVPVGLTFSYPIKQESLRHGTIMKWNKSLDCKDLIGKDVVEVLEEIIKREEGMSNFRVKVLLNDTTSSLLAESYLEPSCMIGIILGTGTNAAYYEDGPIGKLKKFGHGKIELLNTEWGALKCPDIQNSTDLLLNPTGDQMFEKMVSGMYLGELFYLALKERNLLVDENVTIDSELLSLLDDVYNYDDRFFELPKFLLKEKEKEIRNLSSLIGKRSSLIVASLIVGLYEHIGGKKNITVTIDGSLFIHHSMYKRYLNNSLKHCLSLRGHDTSSIVIKEGSGNSIIGAAIAMFLF